MPDTSNISQYTDFFSQLFEDGKLCLEKPNEPTEDDLVAGWELALEFEKSYRLDLPFDPPVLSRIAFEWAATNFYRAAQFVIYRDVPEQDINQALAEEFPGAKNVQAHYSVDLVFRFLPDLRGFANSSAKSDPVCSWIDCWCADWPLSSIGTKFEPLSIQSDEAKPAGGVEAIDWHVKLQNSIDELLDNGLNENRCLMQLYVDRVLATNDRSRLNHEEIVESIRVSVGHYPYLAGELRDVLSSPTTAPSKNITDTEVKTNGPKSSD